MNAPGQLPANVKQLLTKKANTIKTIDIEKIFAKLIVFIKKRNEVRLS